MKQKKRKKTMNPQQPRRETWQKEDDQSIYGIDLFLRCLYDYWLHGGMSFLVARKVTALFKTLTLFAIVVVVVYCIDYSALVALSTGEKTTVSSQTILHAPQLTWLSICWMVGSVSYFCYNAWKTLNQLQQARNIRQFYRCNLNVPNDEMLFWMPWSAVCRRLRKFQYTQWLAEKQSCAERPEQQHTGPQHHATRAAFAGTKKRSADETSHFEKQLSGNDIESKSHGGKTQQHHDEWTNGDTAQQHHSQWTNDDDDGSGDDCGNETGRGVAEFEYEAMLTDDNIATMIMRRENYWIALFADNVLAFESDCTRDDEIDSLDGEQRRQDADSLQRRDELQTNDALPADGQTGRRFCNGRHGTSSGEFDAVFQHMPENQNNNNDNHKEDYDANISSASGGGLLDEFDAQRRFASGARQYGGGDGGGGGGGGAGRAQESQPGTRRRQRHAATRFYFGNSVPGRGTLASLWRAAKEQLMTNVVRPLFITQCDRQSTACVIEKPILTKTLQWCLTYGLFGFAIDSQTGALKHELTLFVEDANTYAERERKRADSRFRSAAEWHRANVSQPLTNNLIWRFRAMAIVGALLSPFIFILVLLSFFFEHGDEVRNEPGRSLGARQWTNEARWAFRRYNELPHLFEARLARGALAAQQYVDSFLFATHGEYARLVSFVAAAALFVFLVLGAVGDEDALSLVQFALHRSAFWWITALSLVIAAARSMVPSIEAIRHETLRRHDNDVAFEASGNSAATDEPSTPPATTTVPTTTPIGATAMPARCGSSAQFDVESNASNNQQTAWSFLKPRADACNVLSAVPNEFLPTPTPQELCAAVAHFTGYYPRSWQRQEHTDDVRKRFFCLYDSKWLIYLREILGILYTPYLLWYVFPQKAQQFLDFFVERTERQHKVGHVCAREQTSAVNASEIV